jgi:hypothetical protein
VQLAGLSAGWKETEQQGRRSPSRLGSKGEQHARPSYEIEFSEAGPARTACPGFPSQEVPPCSSCDGGGVGSVPKGRDWCRGSGRTTLNCFFWRREKAGARGAFGRLWGVLGSKALETSCSFLLSTLASSLVYAACHSSPLQTIHLKENMTSWGGPSR